MLLSPDTDPFVVFHAWLDAAKADTRIAEPTAMCLATASVQGKPSARIVLLKALDDEGFTFYTNLESRKSQELAENSAAALCFYWMPLGRQVRVEGTVRTVSTAEADAYFASRPRGSQIGAWASQQSRPLDAHATLEQRVKETEEAYSGAPVPRPPHWSGWRLVPERFEFWQEGEYRLHQRVTYTRQPNGSWQTGRLYP